MRNLILLVGNIGSGKTTIAKEFVVNPGYTAVSRDAVRKMFAGGGYAFNFDTEPLIFKIERYALLLLLQEGFDVIVDETNTTPKSRAKLVALGQEYNYNIVAYVTRKITRAESVKRRMKDDSRGYTKEKWGDVWDMFDKRYKEPTLEEGFNEIILEQAKGKEKRIKQDPDAKTRRSRD